jgi:hypothetical protein
MAEGSDNARTVRRMIGLYNEGRIEDVLTEVDDAFVLDWSNSRGPLKGVYRGRDGLSDAWTTFTEAWEALRWEAVEVIDVDPSTVIVRTRMSTRGRGSGAEVTASGAQLWSFDDGRPVGVKLYQSKEEALEAVGGSA